MAPEVDAATDPEGHLLARATATEITGKGADDYPPYFRDEVLARYPRLELTEYTCAEVARRPGRTGCRASGAHAVAATEPAGTPPEPSRSRRPPGGESSSARQWLKMNVVFD
ncbi:hypothetical protein [Streptomyces sp. NPDC127039]|uniref:hypothetical protein n=1 Tax=Streptomyces sp. NPDC127039 TaxID=3347115 RepID=UPI00365E8921